MATNKNMELYNKVREVPQTALKGFNNGKFTGTDINPMWRIERLTEVLGPCGIGWYFGQPVFDIEQDGQTKTVHCTVALFIKDGDKWSAPIYGVGGNTIARLKKDGSLDVTDEGYKMAYTDAQSNACKMIGVGANVWFEKSETKYTAKYDEALGEVDACKSSAEVMAVWNNHPELQKDIAFKEKVAKAGKAFKEKEGKDNDAA